MSVLSLYCEASIYSCTWLVLVFAVTCHHLGNVHVYHGMHLKGCDEILIGVITHEEVSKFLFMIFVTMCILTHCGSTALASCS